MEEKDLKGQPSFKYLRIPPWSKIECRICPPREDDYSVHVKVREHRKKGGIKVCGLLFEFDRELPLWSHVELQILLSEDSDTFKGYGRVSSVRKMGRDGPFRTKIDFKASSEEEETIIARFAGKFY